MFMHVNMSVSVVCVDITWHWWALSMLRYHSPPTRVSNCCSAKLTGVLVRMPGHRYWYVNSGPHTCTASTHYR